MKRDIDQIRVVDRYRKSVGDLSDLIASIEDVGLLHPIVITEQGRMIAGQRRLAACCAMGWTDVPVVIAESITDAATLLRAERDENTCRIDMSRSESIRLGMVIDEHIEKPNAKQRMVEGGRLGGKGSGQLPDPSQLGDRRDKVGRAIGVGGRTYQRGKYVVERASTGDPVAVEALKEMDETGSVDAAWTKAKESERQKQFEKVAELKDVKVRTKRQGQMSRNAMDRWDTTMGTLGGISEGLETFRLDRVLEIATYEQIAAWDKTLATAISALRSARKQLGGSQ